MSEGEKGCSLSGHSFAPSRQFICLLVNWRNGRALSHDRLYLNEEREWIRSVAPLKFSVSEKSEDRDFPLFSLLFFIQNSKISYLSFIWFSRWKDSVGSFLLRLTSIHFGKTIQHLLREASTLLLPQSRDPIHIVHPKIPSRFYPTEGERTNPLLRILLRMRMLG